MEWFLENILEWIGYLASFIILISLVMRSIKRLRVINLFGALLFAVYGYFIGALPVMLMNGGIVLINIYYLHQMLKTREFFDLLPIKGDDLYVKEFLSYYKKNISNASEFKLESLKQNAFGFFILRNMMPAGIFVVEPFDKNTLEITLDFATPMYQDFKTSAHIFREEVKQFKDLGYKKFITITNDLHHEKYLLKMGFTKDTLNNKPVYTKTI
jgi:hypothetical protein